MRLITLLYYLYFAVGAIQRDKESNQDTRPSSNHGDKHRARRYVRSTVAMPDLYEYNTKKATPHLKPVTKEIDLFSDQFKECLMQPQVIDILFKDDGVICDGFRKLTKEEQKYIVHKSKDYVLEQFKLPNLKETIDMIQLPDNQFNSTLFRKLKRAGVDPRKASKRGKRFVQNRLIESGTGPLESILHYFWSSTPFRTKFLDKLFKSLASTLTTQEYFEFEALLNWIHTDYNIMNEADYDKLKEIIKSHYRASWYSTEYLGAWYSMRPLEGDNRPVPKPERHWSY